MANTLPSPMWPAKRGFLNALLMDAGFYSCVSPRRPKPDRRSLLRRSVPERLSPFLRSSPSNVSCDLRLSPPRRPDASSLSELASSAGSLFASSISNSSRLNIGPRMLRGRLFARSRPQHGAANTQKTAQGTPLARSLFITRRLAAFEALDVLGFLKRTEGTIRTLNFEACAGIDISPGIALIIDYARAGTACAWACRAIIFACF